MSNNSDALRRWFGENMNTRFITSIGAGILVGLLLSERRFSVRLENGQGYVSLTSDELGIQDFGGGRRMHVYPPAFPPPPPFQTSGPGGQANGAARMGPNPPPY